jgi:putative acetyltransferase
LSVLPSLQGQGIGSRLVREGLARLEAMPARGCVVLGEPAYYSRFGFASDAGLVAEGLPSEYFMSRAAAGEVVAGTVTYHPAFFWLADREADWPVPERTSNIVHPSMPHHASTPGTMQ